MKKRILAAVMVGLFIISFGAGAALAAEAHMHKDVMAAADKFVKMAPDMKYYRFDVKDLKMKIDSGASDFFVLDVRPASFFAKESIAGSVNVPLPTVVDQLGMIPMDKTIYVVCTVDSNSSYAVAVLRMLGFDAHMVPGGVPAWKSAGFPLKIGM